MEDPGHESRLVPELELLHPAGREQPLWPEGPKPLTSFQPHHFPRRTVRPGRPWTCPRSPAPLAGWAYLPHLLLISTYFILCLTWEVSGAHEMAQDLSLKKKNLLVAAPGSEARPQLRRLVTTGQLAPGSWDLA